MMCGFLKSRRSSAEYSRMPEEVLSSCFIRAVDRAGNDMGVNLRAPIMLDTGGYQVEYSGFGISVPRTGTPLSNVLDVGFPSDNGAKWIYFRLDLPPIQK